MPFSGGTAIWATLINVHGQEFNSFRRKTRSKALHEFKLHRREKFLYVCDTLHMWEWDVRVLDIEDSAEADHVPIWFQTRTKVRNNELGEVFRHWYPRFRSQAA